MTTSYLPTVDDIFEALSVCASLHPDELPDESDEEGDDAFVDPDALLNGQFETFDGSDEQELSEVGKVRSDLPSDSRYAPY